MALIIKNQICEILEKTNNAKGIYQFEVIKNLLKSSNGELEKEHLVQVLAKHPECQVSESRLRCHRVWEVLTKKGLIKITDKVVQLVGFQDLNEDEKNDIRNTANQAKRDVTDFREGGYTLE